MFLEKQKIFNVANTLMSVEMYFSYNKKQKKKCMVCIIFKEILIR